VIEHPAPTKKTVFPRLFSSTRANLILSAISLTDETIFGSRTDMTGSLQTQYARVVGNRPAAQAPHENPDREPEGSRSTGPPNFRRKRGYDGRFPDLAAARFAPPPRGA
jgi:hypothetical protein